MSGGSLFNSWDSHQVTGNRRSRTRSPCYITRPPTHIHSLCPSMAGGEGTESCCGNS